MNLLIYPNLTAEHYIEKVVSLIDLLEKQGYQCFLTAQDNAILFNDESHVLNNQPYDLVVSAGGDGTFLRACQYGSAQGKPVCGINCGRHGYLCCFHLETGEVFDFSALKCEEHTMLQTEVDGNTYLAAGDIVVGKDYFGGTIELKVSVDGEPMYQFIGDGLIVSSPLGSSGYNLSAGGEVLARNSNLLALTPICAHSANCAPLLVCDTSKITIELLRKNYPASVYYDGIKAGQLDKIDVVNSNQFLHILTR